MKKHQEVEDVVGDRTTTKMTNTLQFHLGSAENFIQILQQADIIFCYSTAFTSNGFNIDISAMILNDYWCQLLTSQQANIDNNNNNNNNNKKDDNVDNNTIIITTEKAIHPKYNWTIIDRIDVPNPEIFGSTGFIHKKADKTIKKNIIR